MGRGLPKSLYFNLVSIAKQHQFDGIHSTIKPYHKTCEDDVQTLGSVIVRGLGLYSRLKLSSSLGVWTFLFARRMPYVACRDTQLLIRH